jgi:hypothetical protein
MTLNEAFPPTGQGNFQEISTSAATHRTSIGSEVSRHSDVSRNSMDSSGGVCASRRAPYPYVNMQNKFTISDADWAVIGLDRSAIESYHSRSLEDPMVALQQIIAEAGIDIQTGRPIRP